METFLPLLSEFGFPVVVTLYLLHRMEKKLDQLNESILELPRNLKYIHTFRQREEKKTV